MTRYVRLLARFTVIGAAGILLPAVLCAQEGLSVLAVGSAQQELSRAASTNLQGELSNRFTDAAGILPSSPLTQETSSGRIHMTPTTDFYKSLPQADNGPLLYHAGGAVMNPSVTIYPIFWVPAHLQNGGATGMTNHYQAVQFTMLSDYPGHGLDNNNTQYFQTIGGTTTFIQNKGGVGQGFLDTGAYPASGCNDKATPGNCLNDSQIQAEVVKVLNFAHLSGGLNKIFMVFTSSGEGSCHSAASTSCAYVQYCAYHGFFKIGATPVIYSNHPFGTTNGCQVPGAPSPNGDPNADAAATGASHELTEAITDPLLNAWFTSQGNEIGDLCAFKYGPLSWDSGKANEMWNGHFWLLQTEFDNHDHGCFQVGPS